MYRLHPGWLERLERENDNLRAALKWSQSPQAGPELGLRLAAAAWMFWWGRGHWREGQTWLESALALPGADGATCAQARARVRAELGYALGLQGEYAAGQTQLAKSLELFQRAGDLPWSAYVLTALGWTAREHGDAGTARLRLAESLALYRELGDEIGLAQTLNTLGEVAIMQGDTAEAAGLLKEALALNRELERMENTGYSLNHLGHIAQLKGEFELAMRLHEESLLMFRELPHQNWGVGEANQSLGETALAQGDATLATRHFREALDLFRFHGARAQAAWCLAGLAGGAVLDEEPERATRLWGAAEALRLSIGARQAPAARATRERLMAAAREQLGEAAFVAAWTNGQALSWEQAAAYALET
jgi:tetratricopeptide (TPR) repeat protein